MRIVKLDNLPTTYDGSKIDWRKSIGKTVEFIYDDIVGFIDIIDYKDAYLYIKYLDYPIFKIYHGSFKKCCLGKMLNKFTNQFKIDLNYKINDEKRSLVIIDREKRGGYKYYKYVCNKCSYSNWLEESSLIKGVGCACCAGKVVIKGINDIATTRPDLLLYFNNIEDAYINTYGSTKKVICKCPECGNTKPISLQKLSYYGFSCDKCSDGISYPEKFINSMLSQITPEYIYQLSKKYYKWCQNYKYDFVINSKSIIIETHGLNHYTIYNFSSLGGKTLEEEQENDRIKEQLAKQNGIKHYIVLDCRKSELEWIKESVMESKLPTLLNFKEDDIDWLKCHEYACKSIVKIVCDYYNNSNITTSELCDMYNLSSTAILSYLKKGNQIGWCSYNPIEQRNKGLNIGRIISKKPVEIFKDNKSLGKFKSLTDLSKKSLMLFGIKLDADEISKVCRKIRSDYKGFIFKFI